MRRRLGLGTPDNSSASKIASSALLQIRLKRGLAKSCENLAPENQSRDTLHVNSGSNSLAKYPSNGYINERADSSGNIPHQTNHDANANIKHLEHLHATGKASSLENLKSKSVYVSLNELGTASPKVRPKSAHHNRERLMASMAKAEKSSSNHSSPAIKIDASTHSQEPKSEPQSKKVQEGTFQPPAVDVDVNKDEVESSSAGSSESIASSNSEQDLELLGVDQEDSTPPCEDSESVSPGSLLKRPTETKNGHNGAHERRPTPCPIEITVTDLSGADGNSPVGNRSPIPTSVDDNFAQLKVGPRRERRRSLPSIFIPEHHLESIQESPTSPTPSNPGDMSPQINFNTALSTQKKDQPVYINTGLNPPKFSPRRRFSIAVTSSISDEETRGRSNSWSGARPQLRRPSIVKHSSLTAPLSVDRCHRPISPAKSAENISRNEQLPDGGLHTWLGLSQKQLNRMSKKATLKPVARGPGRRNSVW